jgi:hypothetical protein
MWGKKYTDQGSQIVTVVLQWCYSDFTVVSQWLFQWFLQCCCSELTGVYNYNHFCHTTGTPHPHRYNITATPLEHKENVTVTVMVDT